MNDTSGFDRHTGTQTTWVLEAVVDGEWTDFQGLFVQTLDDAAPTIAAARANRPDLTQWRVIDRATNTILAQY